MSDDNSCIIWSNNDEQCGEHSLFPLKSAGMSVKWHPDDSEKILVAEKKGVIHMYNVVSMMRRHSDRFSIVASTETFFLQRLRNKSCYQWKRQNRH